MSDLILFCLGVLLGSIGSTIVMTLLTMSKIGELDQEMHEKYKAGYEKGYKDGQGR